MAVKRDLDQRPKVPAFARAQPSIGTRYSIIRSARADYQMRCGPCSETEHSIRPDVLYFK